ncbi:MAG: hypothetical protein ACREAU_00715 [Nitrosopumilaceae archaeon]
MKFRQGIVRHQKTIINTQDFLAPGIGIHADKVTLKSTNDVTIITFADGNTNYLYTEPRTITNAWIGPFTSPTTYWLYWDIHPITGIRTFGHSLFPPVFAPLAPVSPAVGQHWFNTTSTAMFEWNGSRFVPRIRVFAVEYTNALTFTSLSINSPDFNGTQAGLTVPNSSGSLIFDVGGNPVKRGDGKFFTTEDVFVAGIPTGGNMRINTIILEAQSQAPLDAFTIVQWIDFRKVIPGTPFDQAEVFYGMVEEDASTSEVVRITVEGLITNQAWDWTSLGVNSFLFINTTGELVGVPVIPNQIPVARVVDPQTIILRPPTITTEVASGVTDHGALTGLGDDDHLQYFNEPRGDARYSQLGHLHVKADITDFAHTHPISEVINLQTELDNRLLKTGDAMTAGFLTLFQNPTSTLHAATKGYVDTTTVASAGDTMTGNLIMSAGTDVTLPDLPTVGTDAANKQYVDNVATGIKARPAVNIRTTADMAVLSGQVVTYNNGTAGVNASLTNAPNLGAFPTIDGVLLVLNDRILVADQITSAQNGAYVLTAVGSGISSWVLTRCFTCDESNEIPSSYVFIHQGTLYNKTAWVASVTNPSTFVVGTDGITWIIFSAGDTVPGGANTNIQFNDNGLFGGDGDFTWNKTTNVLTITGSVNISSSLTVDTNTLVVDPTNNRVGINQLSPTSALDVSGDGHFTGRVGINNAIPIGTVVLEITGDFQINSEIRLRETGVGINYIGFKAPVALGANFVWTLPAIDGTPGQVLTTNGLGVLTFTTVSGGGGTCIQDGDADTFVCVEVTPDEDTIRINTGDSVNGTAGTNVIVISSQEFSVALPSLASLIGGSINLTAGIGDDGGTISIFAGQGNLGSGGNIFVVGGNGVTTAGGVFVVGGDGGANPGGFVQVVGGLSTGGGDGGSVLVGGNSGGVNGGIATIIGGDGVDTGGDIRIIAGIADESSSPADGGNIELNAGSGRRGGRIDIISGRSTSGGIIGGAINIQTGSADGGKGNINIFTGDSLSFSGITLGTGNINQAVSGSSFWQQASSSAHSKEFLLNLQTSSVGPFEMFIGSSGKMSIASGESWVFQAMVVARQVSSANTAGYEFRGVIENNAGTTSIVGGVVKTVLGEDIAAWDADVVADNSADTLRINVTGVAATTINWSAFVKTISARNS